jgi:hypothetical protein
MLRDAGVREARAYTERFNFTPQEMNRAAGGKIIKQTPDGYLWSFDLSGVK